MGVKDLWPVLKELCEKEPLTYLSGKKVAVDLSGWVVQAKLTKGLNTSKNPHLRNLFFRVSHLLKLGVHPIFVTEGQLPPVKEAAFKERNFKNERENGSTADVTRQTFDRTLKECEDLLNCLGVPCLKSSGEAEAFCAFLNSKGIVDGVISDDSDAFLYGADIVYRNFHIDDPSESCIHVYSLTPEKNKYNLNRNKLVALALLLGCDYSDGVPHVGKETALKLFAELKCDDVLQRFKDWKNMSESTLFPGLDSHCVKTAHCSRCGHPGTVTKHKKNGCSACDSQVTCYLQDPSKPCSCSWHINEEIIGKCEWKIYNIVRNCPDFPNIKVIEEYLNYTDNIPSEESLDWNCPNSTDFQAKAYTYLGWTFENSFDKIFPLITLWQQVKLGSKCSDRGKFIYEPVMVLKKHIKQGVKCFRVKWKLIGDDSDNISGELITSEVQDRFSICYKEIVEKFYDMETELEEKKKSGNKGKKSKNKRKKTENKGIKSKNKGKKTENKGKKLKSDEGDRKIDEYFVKKSKL